ncbi:MAG TPA: hypothetical protein VF937_13625 [Chloroflexota bacterium]
MADLTFFPDPAVDRVLGVALELAAEVYILRDRLATLERLLERGGALRPGEVDEYQASPDERAARLAARDTLIARILAPMTDESDSPSPPFEPA